ncbi:TonB family protein [Sulfurimonas sp.]|uniref:TonB family protein n=1 Tax=Sulfurimonas sp. TaxID=2022749 RepID=UPI0035649261
MNRYLSSFIITSFIYVSLIAGAVVFFSNDNTFSDKKMDKPNVISVNMISQPKTPKKPIKKKIVKEKKKVVKKKPIKKKVVKKVIKKETLPKKIEQKPVEEIIEKEIKEEIVEEEPIVQETTNTEVKQQVIATKKTEVNLDEIRAKQNIFFTKVRNKIDQNKTYPRSARRRGIEGDVEVSFSLCNDGNVKDIEFLSGKKVFKESIIKAIENSFPMEVDQSLFTFPKQFKISVKYILS